MRRVVFHSYKGGVGKTLLAIYQASRFSESTSTLLIEGDFMMPSYTTLMNIHPNYYFNDLFGDDIAIDEMLEEFLGHDVIACNPQYNPTDKIFSLDPNLYTEYYKSLKDKIESLSYDQIIFDLSPGISMMNGLITSLCDTIIIILRFDTMSLEGTIKLFKQFYINHSLLKDKELKIVFNQIPNIEGTIDIIEEWMSRLETIVDRTLDYDLIYYDPEISYLSGKEKEIKVLAKKLRDEMDLSLF